MRTIRLKNYLNIFEEYIAGEAIQPGALIAINAAGKVVNHADEGGKALAMFALEDELQGKTTRQAYKADTPVQCWIPQRGDQVLGILAEGENVAIGDFLVSSGDGELKKLTDESAEEGWVVGQVLQALDLSGAESTYPASGQFINLVIL